MDGRLKNSKECGSGREKSETNPSTLPLQFQRQEDQEKWPDLFKASRRLFFFPFLLSPWIPSSFLSFFLFLFLLPSFLSFSVHFFSFHYSFFFSFSHRWDSKIWSSEKTRVRPKQGHPNNWDSETNFTLLFQRTCKVGVVNSSTPAARGNPPTKETPTHNNGRRWRREWKPH